MKVMQQETTNRGGFIATRGQKYLFHEQEHVCLGCFQHVAVRMLQALHRQAHCPAVNVDPAGGTRGEEGPGNVNAPDQ